MNTAIVNKKMTVSEFIKKYTSLTGEQAKLGVVKSIMKRTYCPILEKRLILDLMAEKSVGEGKIPYIDMVLNKLNVTMAVIALYTNLEVEKDEKGVPKTAEAYDMLRKTGAIGAIYDEIGEYELGELMMVNDNVLSTWHTKNTSTAAYISDLVEKVSMIFSTALGKEMKPIMDMFNGMSAEEKQNLFSMLKGE